MDGISLPPEDVRLLILFVALFLLIFYFYARAPKPLPSDVSKGSVAMLVTLGMNVLLAGAVVWDIRPNWSLRHLDADRVAAITVDSITIDDRAKVAKIVQALRQNRMFDPPRRQLGHSVRMRIVFTAGEIREYRIVRDLDSPAVFIEFLPRYGIPWGYASSPSLVFALEEANVSLPD